MRPWIRNTLRLVFASTLLAVVLVQTSGPGIPPAKAQSADGVIDDSDPRVVITGNWPTSSLQGGYYGSGYHYHSNGNGSNTFRWPCVFAPGRYEVSVRWTSGENRATNAPYTVTHAEGTYQVVADQTIGGGQWQSLGQFRFSGAPTEGVVLSDDAFGVVVADAVRFTPVSDGQTSATTAPAAGTSTSSSSTDERYFPETGFRISNDRFWDYFQRRGGLRTFGYPISREFQFLGFRVQFFQRLIMQLQPNGSVGTLNLLDEGLMPYTRINFSTFPAPDPALAAAAPSPADPEYASKVVKFVQDNAPDTWEGLPVNFLTTFNNTVTLQDAFPAGDGDASLVPLLNLELWGAPTSKPAYDPANRNFVYQRFQRGIMHYDASNGQTQALLLADYLKSIITGQGLPPDLDEQARGSRFYRQYDSSKPGWVARPAQLPGTDLTNAFEKDAPVQAASSTPADTGYYRAASPEYGISMWIWDNPATTARDLNLVKQLNFGWQKTLFQWRQIEGAGKGKFDWREADRVVKASNDYGIKIIARLDFQPSWARADRAFNGPPDNYQDFADFVYALVDRYKTGSPYGRLHAIEVWNEPNLSREWGDKPINQQQAADYVRLLKLAYAAAKRADPNVTVITAGLSPTGWNDDTARPDDVYLQWLYDAGMKGNYDVLGAHGNTQAPEVDIDINSLPQFQHPSFYFRRVEQLREIMVRNGDADKQIWLLEFGWTSDQVHQQYSWYAIPEEKKAANIVRAFQFARERWAPWIGVMTLWTMSHPAWTADREEYWWAITNPNGTVRPAYNALLEARRNGTLP